MGKHRIDTDPKVAHLTRLVPALALGLVSALISPQAWAGPGCSGELAERIDFLENALEEDELYADAWWHAWNGAFGLGLALDGVRTFTADDSGERANHIAGVAKASIGLARNLWAPPGARKGAAPMQDPSLPCDVRLARGEDALRRNAEETREERFGWKSHLGNLVLNLAHGLVVGELYDEGSGWGSAAVGFFFGEVRIWTHPFQAPDRQERYLDRWPGARRSRL